MTNRLNVFHQPVGAELPQWKGAHLPGNSVLEGRYCRIEPVNAERHAADLFEAYQLAGDGRHWTYLLSDPFETLASCEAWLQEAEMKRDPRHYAVIDAHSNKAVGTFALMRIDPANGVIEVGHVIYSPAMQRTRLSTEVMALLLRYVFTELGYRRFEWKCDSLNAPSRAAALRFGFHFEGIFRQAVVYKGRSRDTAWYSIIDSEYPCLLTAFDKWLAPTNFDNSGDQKVKLAQFIAAERAGIPGCENP